MTYIRVDTEQLRLHADDLESAADRLRALAGRLLAEASAAPSYDGQFRPQVVGLAEEGRAALISRSQRVSELSADLRARADAFDEADREFQEALAGINHRGRYPLSQIQYGAPNSDQEPPWWLAELIIGLIPFGDAYDIGKELIRLITSGEYDELVLILAVLGLLLDAGHLDGPILDPVDAANASVALLKGLVKQIPPGAARDAIQETLLGLVRNLDEAPEFLATMHTLIKHDEVLDVLKDNPRALAAILESGPEAVELLAKNQEVAVALIKHQDVAAALIKNADYLDEIVQGGPEAVEQLLKYGDDFATRYLDAIPENGLAEVGVLRGLEVSKLSQDLGHDIHVAGRWADNSADLTLRELAAKEVADLVDEGYSVHEARLIVAESHNIGFYQARVSSGKSEVDIFIHESEWNNLTPTQRNTIRESLENTFEVDEVDFYQLIQEDVPTKWGIEEGLYDIPDPATSTPPGSIQFKPDGHIEHPPLGEQEFMQGLEREFLDELGDP